MKSKRAFLVAPRKFEIREVDVNPGPGQILVKVEVCGICNWEMNHWKGLLGECPQALGHEWGGVVASLGEGVTDIAVGDGVTGSAVGGLSGFSEYVVSPVGRYFKLAPDVKPANALGEPLQCIVNVLRAASPEAGDTGLVLGCGPMGLWCVQGLAGNMLSALIAVDMDDDKLKLAQRFGATHLVNPKKDNALDMIKEISNGRMADFVIEGTGVPTVLNDAVSYLRNGRGRLIMMSSYSYDTQSALVNIRQMQNKSIELRVATPGYSNNGADDFRRAVALFNKGTFKMDNIISHVFSLDDIQKAFETCENKPKDYIKGVVRP